MPLHRDVGPSSMEHPHRVITTLEQNRGLVCAAMHRTKVLLGTEMVLQGGRPDSFADATKAVRSGKVQIMCHYILYYTAHAARPTPTIFLP